MWGMGGVVGVLIVAECHYSNNNSAIFQNDRLYKHCHAMLFWKPLALFWLDNCGYRLKCYCN